ncbi:hypothetical protein BS643_02555 [Pseudomonas protegens]|nr:hypothetical protein BBH58_20125 [Pseudomonas protegens]OBZ30573.1 hypothetical protein BBH57_11965 [Pseudomonas protegens]OKK44284.1 hypothetical protein BS644_27505 [Pseudomonas protegens]OKK50249.1 hypothetical protein BS643_02555 [Pseudomonas protegens]OKK56311.1 hypothetical protein BS645_20145 [Pseudomonas protegens]
MAVLISAKYPMPIARPVPSRARRSWLASESVGWGGARLTGLFAGKPAPTGRACGMYLAAVGAGLPAKASVGAMQGLRACSPASRLLGEERRVGGLWALACQRN